MKVRGINKVRNENRVKLRETDVYGAQLRDSLVGCIFRDICLIYIVIEGLKIHRLYQEAYCSRQGI